MNKDNFIKQIKDALTKMKEKLDFLVAAKDLLDVLGYRSKRTLELSGRVDDFIEKFPAPNKNTKTEEAFRDKVQSVRILFQVTDTEIEEVQSTDGFDKGNAQSFLFVAIELKGASYSRGQYAQFTREINKRINLPTVVLFKTAADHLLSLSFVYRREHKRDPNRDVLGQVSLIREIDPTNPHRAHLDILTDLSLPQRLLWMDAHKKPRNFDGLLEAWLDALDTEALNRRFYRDLFVWFNRAAKKASFPSDPAKTLEPEEHIIRLITRLMFVWFIKEKRLIAEELFIEEQVTKLLKNYNRDAGDSYYRAVLQNLFFATLNTEIDKRGFSQKKNVTHRDFSRYRYKKEIADPDKLLKLFSRTPFINGGLFDCLDSEEATRDGGWRLDCFSDVHYHKLSLPNRLFFGADGLIPLFNRYKFTVEENTPAEREVALDPELLGKVFENLLAAHNPETRDTARKQTGSYYTPRPVVDYMVDEALVATLMVKAQPDDGDGARWQEGLRYLLDYAYAFDDAKKLFKKAEAERLVQAIAKLKVLDPAVGSGAFPMGVLHKLTLALRRLDPDNVHWEELQKKRAHAKAGVAFDTQDQQEREAELKEISKTFEHYRDSDFGRKLYLIQNSIFGVDIQPIATQIAKLRFFISLAIEQEANEDAPNFGIKPLPNLETRFIAADTLLNLDKSAQMNIGQTDTVNRLEQELKENRERHFHATTRRKKLDCRDEDKRLRRALAKELKAVGFPEDDANKIAQWDPYDQNAKADWFDSEYMFGVADGYDVVIGNPPYIQLQKDGGKLGKLYNDIGYQTFARTGDIYQLFYEKGCQVLRPKGGLLAFITSNSWLKAEYGKATRRYFVKQHTPLQLLEMGKDVFENTIVDTNILIARHGKSDAICKAVDIDRLPDKTFPPDENLWGKLRPREDKPWSAMSVIEQSIMDEMEAVGTPLKEWDVSIYRGVTTGLNDAFIIDDVTKEELVAADPKSAEIIKPVLRGRGIQRYQAKWAGLWLVYARKGIAIERYPAIYSHLRQHQKALSKKAGSNQWYELQASPSDKVDALFKKEKLFWMDLTEQGRFAYDAEEMFCVNTAFMMSGQAIKYLCAVLNSRLITWFMRNTALNSGMGVPRWILSSVERIPIPKITAEKQKPFIRLVDRILKAKAKAPDADTSKLEEEMDRLVYQLYGLTKKEVAALNRGLRR